MYYLGKRWILVVEECIIINTQHKERGEENDEHKLAEKNVEVVIHFLTETRLFILEIFLPKLETQF